MSISCRSASTRFLFAAALAFASTVVSANTAEFYGSYENFIDLSLSHETYLTDGTGASVGVGPGVDPHYAGYASPQTGAVGSYAYVEAPSNATLPSNEVGSSAAGVARQTRFVTAVPGAGLTVGDPVTLQMDIRIDGAIDWGFLWSPVGNISGYVETRAFFDIVPRGSGGIAAYDVFRYISPLDSYASFDLSLLKNFDALIEPDGAVTMSILSGFDDWQFNEWNSGAWRTGQLGASMVSLEDPVLDTGLLSFQFDVSLGDEIDIVTGLGTVSHMWADAGSNGWMWLTNDFLNTMQFSVTAVTPGVTLSAVPLPPAAWLFISGLMGLVGVARMRSDTPRVQDAEAATAR